MDLNGDGTAEPEIADELTGRASATVDRINNEWNNGHNGQMNFHINVNEYPQKAWSRWSMIYVRLEFAVRYGEFDPDLDYLNRHASSDSYRLENFDIQLLDGERFVLSADTMVYDYLSQGVVEGRMSWIFRCISGKGRNTGK